MHPQHPFEMQPHSFVSDGSTASSADSESHSFKRVVGFQETKPYDSTFNSANQTVSEYSKRMTRQSSLGQALLLHDFDQERPKLSLKIATTRYPSVSASASALPTMRGGGSGDLGTKGRRTNRFCVHKRRSTMESFDPDAKKTSEDAKENGTRAAEARTKGVRPPVATAASKAMPIPVHLSKAYSTPDPLPELSPATIERLMHEQSEHSGGENAALSEGAKDERPRPKSEPSVSTVVAPPDRNREKERTPSFESQSTMLRSLSPMELNVAIATANNALAEVAALKQALSREQKLVAELRSEVAGLTRGLFFQKLLSNNNANNGLANVEKFPDVEIESTARNISGPVTPETAEQTNSPSWRKQFA